MVKYRYGVILDAGSSGTRVHVYRWLDSDLARDEASKKELKSLPKLITKNKWTKKIHPGISTFGENPTAVGEEHLKELFKHALTYVPDKQVEDTPLFLMATAGVRLLPDIQRSALLTEICSYAIMTTKFFLPDCRLHVQAIDGETEGLYGWIAANYLVGGFDSPEEHEHGKSHHTYGFLDMGGASAQIAFEPNSTEVEKHANDLRCVRMRTLNGATTQYQVFVATWLGFGMHQARQRYVEALEDSIMDSSEDSELRKLPDPCLPAGLITTPKGDEIDSATAKSSNDISLIGQGLFDECLRKTYPLLSMDAPCPDSPCLINGQHVPAIDFDVNHFIGVSEYWHTTHGVFGVPPSDKAYDFNTYQSLVNEFCSQKWATIKKGVKSGKWGPKVDAKTAMETCFKSSWLINVLHEGIGIPRVGLEGLPNGSNGTNKAKEESFLRPFQAVDEIDGTEVSWTLGKMVLYAAGQIRPEDPATALPVGFGNYTLATDFHPAGSSYSSIRPVGDDDDDYDDDWTDSASDITHNGPRKATSGTILFILLIVLIAFIFRKPERRRRVYNKFNSVFRENHRPGSPRKGARGFFTSTLFGRGSGNYERVLEDGDAPHEYELRDVDLDDDHSDSSDGTRAARTSGLATPKVNVVNYSEGGSFDAAPKNGSAAGVGLNISATQNAMNRSGLVVRTESTGGGIGNGRSKSRTGSPTRKGALMRAVGEDD